jgi:hypothetical protein
MLNSLQMAIGTGISGRENIGHKSWRGARRSRKAAPTARCQTKKSRKSTNGLLKTEICADDQRVGKSDLKA